MTERNNTQVLFLNKEEISKRINDEIEENYGSKKLRRRTSGIWNHFTYIDSQSAKCNVCQGTFNSKSTITNLKKHMEYKHPDVYYGKGGEVLSITDVQTDVLDSRKLRKKKRTNSRSNEDLPDLLKNIDKSNITIDKVQIVIRKNENFEQLEEVYISEDDFNYDNERLSNDDEQIKTSLGLAECQVVKPIEIIEHIDSGDFIKTRNKSKRLKKDLTGETSHLRDKSKLLKGNPDTAVSREEVNLLIENISSQCKKMSMKQFLIAEYKIHEIIYLGLSEQLKSRNDEC